MVAEEMARMSAATAGPTKRARFHWAELMAMAFMRSRLGTRSGSIACQAGKLKAKATPITETVISITTLESVWKEAAMPRARAQSIITIWPMRMIVLRLYLSAKKLTKGTMKSTGRKLAIFTDPTRLLDPQMSFISHSRAALWIHR